MKFTIPITMSGPSQHPPVAVAADQCGWLCFITIGGRLVRHARRLVFQLAEATMPRALFRQVLERISGLHPSPG